MSSIAFDTKRISIPPDVIAADGSEVRVLCATSRGGMALFTLAAVAVAKAVAHRTVEEIWYFTGGQGRIWRKSGEREDIAEIAAGISLSIRAGTHFLPGRPALTGRSGDRCEGEEPIEAVTVTMPPWPGDGEATIVAGTWPPTV